MLASPGGGKEGLRWELGMESKFACLVKAVSVFPLLVLEDFVHGWRLSSASLRCEKK